MGDAVENAHNDVPPHLQIAMVGDALDDWRFEQRQRGITAEEWRLMRQPEREWERLPSQPGATPKRKSRPPTGISAEQWAAMAR